MDSSRFDSQEVHRSVRVRVCVGGGACVVIAFMNLFNTYLLSTYYMPGFGLGSRDTAANKTHKSLPSCTFLAGRQTIPRAGAGSPSRRNYKEDTGLGGQGAGVRRGGGEIPGASREDWDQGERDRGGDNGLYFKYRTNILC